MNVNDNTNEVRVKGHGTNEVRVKCQLSILTHFGQFYKDSCRNRVTVANLAKLIWMLAGTQVKGYGTNEVRVNG